MDISSHRKLSASLFWPFLLISLSPTVLFTVTSAHLSEDCYLLNLDVSHGDLPVSYCDERSCVRRGTLLHDLPQSWTRTRRSCRNTLLPGYDDSRIDVPDRSCGDILGKFSITVTALLSSLRTMLLPFLIQPAYVESAKFAWSETNCVWRVRPAPFSSVICGILFASSITGRAENVSTQELRPCSAELLCGAALSSSELLVAPFSV